MTDLHNTDCEADEGTGRRSADCDAETGEGRAEDKEEPASCSDGNEGTTRPAGTDYRACPWPAEPPEEGLLWYRRPDGSLVSFDGISTLLALPAELRAPIPKAVERVIEGKKYLVFRT